MFTYVTFHLSEPPYGLSTAALGSLFVVYLVGAAVTPFAGHWVDARGHRAGLAFGVAIGVSGAVLTLIPWVPAIVAGLAMVATGVFVSQATASSFIGSVTADDRGLAVGLYSSCYYAGGSLGGALPALFWTTGGWTACVVLVVAVQLLTASRIKTGVLDAANRARPPCDVDGSEMVRKQRDARGRDSPDRVAVDQSTVRSA